MADTKALFTQRFDAARTAWTAGDEPAAAESLHWAIVTARSDPSLRKELASALYNLGKLSRKFGRAGEAEAGPLLTEALTISEELFGRTDAALGPVLHELSRLYLQRAQHARAEDALQRLLTIARLKGDEHQDVATALSDLAFVKRKIGDDASAEALYRDALRIREKVLEPDHTITVGTLERLSETCAARGNFVEALALLNRALPTREAALGAGHERVRAARSRAAEFELQIAIAADTAAAAEARATRDITPTPAWLKRVPDSPADTPSSHVPSPINSKELTFLGDSEPRALRPVPRARPGAKTPTVTAAVAAASLMASSIPTPSASQIAISPPESARPSETIARRESGATHLDGVFADIAYAAAANVDTATGEWRSPVTPIQADSPETPRKKRTALYASAGGAAIVVAIAAMLMMHPRSGGSSNPVATETTVAQRSTDAGAPVAPAAATRTVSVAAGAAAMVVAPAVDSLRSAKAIPVPTAAVAQSEQRAPESTPLRTPRVEVHLDSINVPMPAALSADSIVSAMERHRASDTDRAVTRREVSLPAATDVVAHTFPKLIGRVPDPGFPDALLRTGPREGQVVVRFMVNEFGRVDVATMIVERSDHELFTAAVREILPRFRFEPAHTLSADAKPVPAWVSVPFRFTTKKR